VSGARRLLLAALLLLGACAGPDLPGEAVDDEELVQTARDIVALVGGYNCELLPGYLPSGSAAFFHANIGPGLMDGMDDPVERVCFVLGVVQDYPRSETMEVRAETLTEDGADLLLLGNGRRAELRLVRDRHRWLIDQGWALEQVQNLGVYQALRSFAIAQDQFYYYGPKRFTDNYQELSAQTHTALEFFQGIAEEGSQPMVLYGVFGPNAQSVCGSSRSLSGELFMIRAAADGSASYARGASLPARCPGSALRPSW
jgi:hypothetical protein